ncbi:hypothetical protein [Sphingorhabdus sp.]|uniref:hypothetical protein n=1 Tax=Sphingorhabdus sp. TaxID=1902408 RepID=UPI0038FCD8B8
MRRDNVTNVVFLILSGLMVSACSSEPRCDSPIAIKKLIGKYKERNLDLLIYNSSNKKIDFDKKQTIIFGHSREYFYDKLLDVSNSKVASVSLEKWMEREADLYNEFQKAKSKAIWNLSNIYTVKKYEVTGNVLCEAVVTVDLEKWGSSSSENFKYNVMKTPEGNVVIDY